MAPSSGDSIIVSASGSIVAPAQSVSFANNNATGLTILNSGSIFIINFYLGGGDFFHNTASGVISGNSSGPLISASNISNASRILNDGQISNSNGTAVFLQGANDYLRNMGSIDGYFGVVMSNLREMSGLVLDNLGVISGRAAGVVLSASSGVNNAGTITGGSQYAVYSQASTIVTHTVQNSGLLSSTGLFAVYAQLTAGSTYTLINSGTISGTTGISTSAGSSADSITNSGDIFGHVDLGAGDDFYLGTGGAVYGSIFLGAGNDTADLRESLVTIQVYGGSGSDYYLVDSDKVTIIEQDSEVDQVFAECDYTLAANIEYLTLGNAGNWLGRGNAAVNVISGGHLDNRIYGYEGNDTLYGGLGDDRIFGGTGNDAFFGGADDDHLAGNIGNDSMKGDAGDDTLAGGQGKDTLFGGQDADVFLFQTLAHTGTTQALADVISDFSAGEDWIDLSGVDAKSGGAGGNDAFTFIGTAAFSSVAGQLRYAVNATFIVLEMDVNGDGISDGFIRVNGTTSLSVDALIL